jgi:hypothetical protein
MSEESKVERFLDVKRRLDGVLEECETAWRDFKGTQEEYRKIRLGLLIASKYLGSLRLDPELRSAAQNKTLIEEAKRKISQLEDQLRENKQKEADQP